MAKLTDANRLSIKYPEIAAEWDYAKNGDLTPNDVSYGSEKKVWWTCKNGHKYIAMPVNRIRNGGCPYCAHKKTIIGETDLETCYPEIAKEWHPIKNGDIKPNQITVHSGRKIWWKCSICGYEWKTIVNNRTTHKSGCPNCNKQNKTSFPEQAIYYYLDKYSGYEIKNRSQIKYKTQKLEVDVFIPELRIGIEYDGLYFHKNREKQDAAKDKKLSELGITIYRIKASDSNYINGNIIYCKYSKTNYTDLQNAIGKLCEKIHIKINDINIDRDRFEIIKLLNLRIKENSLGYNYPELLQYWDKEKNKNIDPYKVSSRSNFKIWVKCANGHSHEIAISNYTKNGFKCPYCSKTKISEEYNLATEYPEVKQFWDYDKNENGPESYYPFSEKIVNWKCSSGHHWSSSIQKVTSLAINCPKCKELELKTKTSLGALRPDLLSFWDYDNNKISPYDVVPGSNKIVNWKCPRGHIWSRDICSTTKNGANCPVCKGRKVKTKTSLGALRPDLLSFWDYDNNELTPYDVSPYSAKIVSWKCLHGHIWNRRIDTITIHGANCPECKKLELKNKKSLAAVRPDLLRFWDYANNAITPYDVTPSAKIKVSWRCPQGHTWSRKVDTVTKNGANCPECKELELKKKTNISMKNPGLLKFWDYDHNEISPEHVTQYSHKVVYWKCSQGHVLLKKIADVTLYGINCPICKEIELKNETSLAVVRPDLLNFWDYDNNIITPNDVTPISNKTVNWKCSAGHQFSMSVYARVKRKSECTICDDIARSNNKIYL